MVSSRRRIGIARELAARTVGDRDTDRALTAYMSLVYAAESLNVLLIRQLDTFGLTMGQFRVLASLLHGGAMSPSALAERLVCGPPNIVCLVKNLEKHGLVARRVDKRDRRCLVVELAPEGRELIARVFPLHAKLVLAQMKALRNREQETLQRICEKLGIGNPIRMVKELMNID
jgi:MarR family transcriptional regulator, 2-MHQ and catechol-resistance regulon repressor